jgi:exonuclease SbcC
MLQGIEIKNYQSHRDTCIEFHPRMNVITGSSDFGKSAIIRAILWAIMGRPMGEAFKSWSATDAEEVLVALEFDNEWFAKHRLKGKNFYEAGAFKGKLEAMKYEVPEVIQKISDITDYNIQTQHQPYFMLQMSSGDRAKKLNELVGLDIIDQVFKKLNSKIHGSKGKVSTLTESINSLEYDLEGYKNLDSVQTQILKLDADMSLHQETAHRSNLIATLLSKLSTIDKEIEEQNKMLEIFPFYQDIINKLEDYQILQEDLDFISSNYSQLTSINSALEETKVILEAEPIYTKINKQVVEYKKQADKATTLNKAIRTLYEIEENLEEETSWLAVEKSYLLVESKLGEYKNQEVFNGVIKRNLIVLTDIERSINKGEEDLEILVEDYTNIIENKKSCPTCGSAITDSVVASIKVDLLSKNKFKGF